MWKHNTVDKKTDRDNSNNADDDDNDTENLDEIQYISGINA